MAVNTKSYMTGDDIITSTKRRAMVPENQSTFTDDDFLDLANEEMDIALVPSVIRVHEDYFLVTDSLNIVAGQNRYAIPDRAVGNKMRNISFKDTNGNIYEMARINIGDLPYYNGPASASSVYSYYMENNEAVLVPENSINTSGVLQFSYYRRPSRLVKLANVGVIETINRNTGQITINAVPTGFSTLDKFDFVQVSSPHRCLSIDLTVLDVDSNTNIILFNAADIPSNLVIGDHLAIAFQTAIPQVPSDLHVVLAHRVALRCLEAIGDTEGLQMANQKLGEMENSLQNLIEMRVEDSPKKITNRHGALRQGLYSRRYRFRG